MSSFKNMSLGTAITVIGLWLLLVIGWVMNIVDLVAMESLNSGLAIVRIIGIAVFPLGAIMGWFF